MGYGDSRIPGAPLDGVFGGIDFTPFDYMRVMIEHDGENINASATYWWKSWIATEVGLLTGLRTRYPERTFLPATEYAVCANMKLTTLDSAIDALRERRNEVTVPDDIREQALRVVTRMVE